MHKQKETIKGNRKRLYIYPTNQQKEKIRVLAEMNNVSMSNYVLQALEKHLDKIITLDLK